MTVTGPLKAAEITEKMKTLIRNRVDYGYNPGIIIGITKPEGREYYSYGTTTYGQEVTPDEKTLYEIGSITKVFTASLLSEMSDRGELRINDRLSSHLPDEVTVPRSGQFQITLRHLATHISGLPDNPPAIHHNNPLNPFFPFSHDDLFEFLGDYSLPRRPGASFEYSNLGLGLLGVALAERAQISFRTLLKQRIIEPLGLNDTGFQLTPEQSSRRAPGYSGVVDRPPFKMDSIEGAGALVSSASDMLTFLEHQVGLRNSSIAKPLKDTQKLYYSLDSPGADMGLGWFIFYFGDQRILMHDGATMGHRSFIGFDLESQSGVVVLTNARINDSSEIQDIGFRALVRSFPLTNINRQSTVPLDTKRSYFGRYEGEQGDYFDVKLQHDHLTIDYSGDNGTDFTLYADRTNEFSMKELGVQASATFHQVEQRDENYMIWRQSGQSSRYNKVELPSGLQIERNNGTSLIHLTGDTGIDYIIDKSQNLVNWSQLTTTTIWDDPVQYDNSEEEPAVFFRVRRGD